jgi:hypothetical protein
LVDVESDGLLLAASGTAVLASGGGSMDVNNYGTISGSLVPAGGQYYHSSTYSAGATVQGDLINSGLVEVGGRNSIPPPGQVPSLATTTVTGNFVQTSPGTLQMGVDFNILTLWW